MLIQKGYREDGSVIGAYDSLYILTWTTPVSAVCMHNKELFNIKDIV